jgi:HD-GYP domain-containing protein (c-di-GMP phosphodiesterase class II)
VLSLITGIGLGYNPLRLKDLGTGALLHDIGKLRIPGEILKKPSQLTVEEFEEIKRHTVYGYEILKDNQKVSMISAFIAFGHHERYDGSGYPLQLRGENIHQCARIVAAADVFDALSSDRVYRKKLRTHEVIEYIISLGSRHFDPEIVRSFIKYIAIYPVGTGVMLSTGERGQVVRVNKAVPTKPVVRVVFDSANERVDNSPEIDLSKDQGIYIVDACNL